MDDSHLLTGSKSFPPETMKLIVLTDEPTNPLRPAPKKKVAMRVAEEITWVREMNAAITYIHGGRVLKQESIHADYWGFLRAADDLFADHASRMKEYGVTSESSLEITIRMALMDHPTLGFVKEGWGGRKLFTPVGSGVWLSDCIPDDADFFDIAWENRVPLRPVTHSVEDVWSSRRSWSENEAAFEAFRQRADSVERVVGMIRALDDDIAE